MTMANGFCVSEPMPVDKRRRQQSKAGDQGRHHDRTKAQQRSSRVAVRMSIPSWRSLLI